VLSAWERLFIGMVLGAFAMRCAMLDHRLHWYKFNRKSNNKEWVNEHVGTCYDDDKDSCHAVSSRLLGDASFGSVMSVSPTFGANKIDSAQVVKETHNEQSIEPNSDVTALVVQPNREAIELEDLDQLEDYLYGDVPPAPFQAPPAEPDEPPKFPDAMWKVSFSVDAVMRPLQEMFAPDLTYRAVDADLCTLKMQSDAFRDNREIVKSILRSIGRFAIRQDNIQLLTRVWEYSASTDQDELWQFLEVAIEYGRLFCFQYLLSFVDGEDAQAQALEFCAFHDQVEMMKQAFDKWTKFVKTDTANAPLVVAAAQGQMKSVQFLLTKCTNVDIDVVSPFMDKNYPNAVIVAAAGGHVAIVQELIAAGAKLIKDWSSPHPLQRAINTKNATMLVFLLEYDSSLFTSKLLIQDGILELTQQNDLPELMQFVLTKRKNNGGWYSYASKTPVLLAACQKGQLEIMHTLINHGAAYKDILPHITNCGDTRSFAPTVRGRYELVVELLRLHCKKGCDLYIPQSSIISRLAWLGDVEGLRMLFDEEPKVEVNVADQSGSSPLFYAMLNHMKMLEGKLESTRQQWLRTIRLLLARGAGLNMTDTQYWSTHHGGVPKEILSGLKERSKRRKSNIILGIKR
jgi:ankyrin repeat protein